MPVTYDHLTGLYTAHLRALLAVALCGRMRKMIRYVLAERGR